MGRNQDHLVMRASADRAGLLTWERTRHTHSIMAVADLPPGGTCSKAEMALAAKALGWTSHPTDSVSDDRELHLTREAPADRHDGLTR